MTQFVRLDGGGLTVRYRDTSHNAQPLRLTGGTAWSSVYPCLFQGRIDWRFWLKHQLKAPQRDPLARMQQPIGPNAMKPSRLDMLKESPKELPWWQCHLSNSLVFAVAIPERNGPVGALHDRMIRKRGFLDVPPQVLKDAFGALNAWFTEYVPLPFPLQIRQLNRWHRFPSEEQKSAAELLGQCFDGYEKFLLSTASGPPRTAVIQRSTGHQHVDVRMPIESARPSMQHRERPDASTKVSRIATQR